MSEPPQAGVTGVAPDPELVSWTHWMYALHALSAGIGIFGSAFVVTAFVFGWPSIIAVIMNYARRSQARGTWLESHFAWQLRTFWWAAFWLLVLGTSAFVFAVTILLIPLAVLTGVAMVFVGLWAVYRIVRGWLRLRDGLAL